MVRTDFGSVYPLVIVSLCLGFSSYSIAGGFVFVSMDVGGLGRIGGDEVLCVEVEEYAVEGQVVVGILTSDARDVTILVGVVV